MTYYTFDGFKLFRTLEAVARWVVKNPKFKSRKIQILENGKLHESQDWEQNELEIYIRDSEQ